VARPARSGVLGR